MSPSLKKGLKRVRASQPLNWAATTLPRACGGSSSGWLVKHLPRAGAVTSAPPNGRGLKFRSDGDDWITPFDGTNPVSNYLFTTKGADELAATK